MEWCYSSELVRDRLLHGMICFIFHISFGPQHADLFYFQCLVGQRHVCRLKPDECWNKNTFLVLVGLGSGEVFKIAPVKCQNYKTDPLIFNITKVPPLGVSKAGTATKGRHSSALLLRSLPLGRGGTSAISEMLGALLWHRDFPEKIRFTFLPNLIWPRFWNLSGARAKEGGQ